MQRTIANSYSGFDGGSMWSNELKDHTRGGGEIGWSIKHPLDPLYYVKKNQGTWYKYVAKDENGYPKRGRVGRRIFDMSNKVGY